MKSIGWMALALAVVAAHGEDHGHGHDRAACGKNREVVVPASVQRTMGLGTVRAERRRVVSSRAFPGRFETTPESRRAASAPLAGRLTLHVAPPARVAKGDALFSVFSPDLAARTREIAVLEKRLDVYRAAKTTNAALEGELEIRRAARDALLAGATETNGVVTVRAAADGQVDGLLARDGAWIEAGATAVELADPRALRFRALVAASDAAELSDGLAATVGGAKGRVRLGIGDATGLVPLYVVFDGEIPSVIAGAASTAVCALDANEDPKPAVPSDCVVMDGLGPVVFVRDAHDRERFIAVPVVPGARGGGWTAVEGLPDGAEAVRAGAYELKLALASGGPNPAGHFHADGEFHEGEH